MSASQTERPDMGALRSPNRFRPFFFPETRPPVESAPREVTRALSPPPVIPPRFDANYLDNPAPPYPRLSRKLGEQGTVFPRVYVGLDGTPTRLEVKQSSGYARLDDVALNTVKQWRFVPARQGALAIGEWVIVPISFSLKG